MCVLESDYLSYRSKTLNLSSAVLTAFSLPLQLWHRNFEKAKGNLPHPFMLQGGARE
jgi:hypothetical protein